MTSIPTGLFDSKILASESEKAKVWDVRPFQLVSLLDMIKFLPYDFLLLLRELDGLIYVTLSATEDVSADAPADPFSPIPKDVLDHWREILGRFEKECKRLELCSASDQVKRMQDALLIGGSIFGPRAKMREHGEQLKVRIEEGLQKRTFMFMPSAEAKYYEQKKLFGQKVYQNFKSARNDVKEAGNCFATGRYTASVFHATRVAEKGLHALVNHLNNTYGTNISFNKPIDECNWGTIIPKVKVEIDRLIDPSRQPQLPKHDAKFLSNLASEFRYIQKGWRDDTAHSRLWIDDPREAILILEHAKSFMQHLASRVKE
jgi:hypothetical protein